MNPQAIQQPDLRTAEKQALRLRRFRLAASSYALVLALLGASFLMGYVRPGAAALLTAMVLAVNAGLYAAFRSGFNLRFADPSLTKAQILLATTVLMIGLYEIDVERGISVSLCYLIFLFGLFRLSTRELVMLSLYASAAYALALNLLMHLRPDAMADVRHEWFAWFILTVTLPWFGVIGGRIRALRDRLRERNRELQEAIDTIQAMATRDEVTGLYNRAFFTESLDHAIAQAMRHRRNLGVLFIDLDRFKLINDSLGHSAGDRALREIGERIRLCVRSSDIVARLGGDEFVALIESLPSPEALEEVAQKIIEGCAGPFQLERRELALSVSIGIAVMPRDARDAQTFMRNADAAMYSAKAQGGNCHRFYTPQMSEHAESRLVLEGELQRAAERGELRLLYQPKVDVADGAIRGAEALLRWQHPRLGLLSPDRFIQLAEETGAIVSIGRWVLMQACTRAAGWPGAYTIAVNLSARQFADPGLLGTVEAALAQSGLDPQRLELEITESMVMHDPEASTQIMRDLRALGARLSMDDFGTGYSSLGYLKRFPISTVKLDRSFVRDLPHRDDDVAIARAVFAMARSLRMDVTAEGVERADQLDFLRREGCRAYQGYFCSPPITGERFVALLEAPHADPRLAFAGW